MNTYRCDSNGVPFDYPTCYLDEVEFYKVVSEINTNYRLYENKSLCSHYSIGIDGEYYVFYFENRGYNDYNIIGKFNF